MGICVKREEIVMPRIMEKKDWIQTVANVGASDGVWYENISGNAGAVFISLPGVGQYQLILVKINSDAKAMPPAERSARDLIGYGARFHRLRPTEDWMKELREGEAE